MRSISRDHESGDSEGLVMDLEVWAEALRSVAPVLQEIGDLAVGLARHEELWHWDKERRRSVADTIAWLREVAYTAAGHLGGAIHASRPRGGQRTRPRGDVGELRRVLRHYGEQTEERGSDQVNFERAVMKSKWKQ